MSVAFFIVLAVLLLLLVSGAYVFVAACVRRKEVQWLVKKEVNKTPFKSHYEQIVKTNQWLKDHDIREIYIESADGLKLCGLWIPADHAKGTALLVHGYRSTFLVDFGYAFDYYHSLGLNILVPYQRSHGKSEGRYITFGVKESKDIVGWIDYHNQNLGAYPIVLSGLSMGASTVLYLADADLPDNVRGIIADCGFTSPWEILSSVYRSVTHLSGHLTLWITELYARIFADFSLKEKDSRVQLANSRLPVLLVHGMADDFVPCNMSVKAYDACNSEKRLLLVEGAGHGVSFLKAREQYTDAVVDFIDKFVIKEKF